MEVGNEQRAIDQVHAAVQRAARDGHKVLLLLPGGSAAQLIGPLVARLDAHQDNLTISLTDERYGPVGHANSNWPVVAAVQSTLPRTRVVPLLGGGTLAETATAFASLLANHVSADGAIVALLGIGTDCHTASIKPQ